MTWPHTWNLDLSASVNVHNAFAGNIGTLISGGACLKFAFNLENVMHHLVDFLNETIAINNKNNPIKICNFSIASKMESFASSDAQDHIELVGYA